MAARENGAEPGNGNVVSYRVERLEDEAREFRTETRQQFATLSLKIDDLAESFRTYQVSCPARFRASETPLTARQVVGVSAVASGGIAGLVAAFPEITAALLRAVLGGGGP